MNAQIYLKALNYNMIYNIFAQFSINQIYIVKWGISTSFGKKL